MQYDVNMQQILDSARQKLANGECPFLRHGLDPDLVRLLVGTLAEECLTFEQLLRLCTLEQHANSDRNHYLLTQAFMEISQEMQADFREEYNTMCINGSFGEYSFNAAKVLAIFEEFDDISVGI